MAVTKIDPVHDSVKRLITYIMDSTKTEFPDGQIQTFQPENKAETGATEENMRYVTGLNCNPDTAWKEMEAIQERFGKDYGVLAYHACQSFKPGEVTPELCHEIGVKLAKKMWGSKYQVVVATHFNTGAFHNHFAVNAVQMWTGEKFNCDKKAYYLFRSLSDELCRENHLSIIECPRGHTHRMIYLAEQNGEPTRDNLMREAIDQAISVCRNKNDFVKILHSQGYEFLPYEKYPAIRAIDDEKPVSLYFLGEEYELERIKERIREQDPAENFKKSKNYWKSQYAKGKNGNMRCKFSGNFKNAAKITGYRALYLEYCCMLGAIPQNAEHRPIAPKMKQAWRQISNIKEEAKLVVSQHLETQEDVDGFVEHTKEQIKGVERNRDEVSRATGKCQEPEQQTLLLGQRDAYNGVLKKLRKDIKTAEKILKRVQEMQQEIIIEKKLQRDIYAHQRIRNIDDERER